MSNQTSRDKSIVKNSALDRRSMLLGGTTLAAASAFTSGAPFHTAQAQQTAASAGGDKPNIVVIVGDDIGYWNIGAYHQV